MKNLHTHITNALFIGKDKAIPLQACTGLESSRSLRLPEFLDSRHMKVVMFVSPTHRPPLPHRKYSWYSFLLEAESLKGHSATGRIMSMKNSNDTIGNRTRDLAPSLQVKCKTKGKFRHITFHEDQEGEQRYSSTLSLTSSLDGVGVFLYRCVQNCFAQCSLVVYSLNWNHYDLCSSFDKSTSCYFLINLLEPEVYI